MQKVIFGLFILLFSASQLIAQRDYKKFERISVEDGLSQSSVYSIIQDSRGFMWFATSEGLNRYDGYSFKIYKVNRLDSTSISDSWIVCLYESQSGDIWIGTYGGGLNKFDMKTEKVKRFMNDPKNPNTISNNIVYDIAEDKEGYLWLTTNKGLNRFSPKNETFKRFIHDPEKEGTISDDIINSVYCTSDGTIWAGTENGGLNKYNRTYKAFEVYKYSPDNKNGISNNTVWQMIEDPDDSNKLWIATFGGLNCMDTKNETFKHYRHNENDPFSLVNDQVRAFMLDSKGTLWIGTKDGGLSLLTESNRKKGKFINYKNNPNDLKSISKNWILSFCEDESGIIWIGTKGGGLNKTILNKFTHYKKHANNPLSLHNNSVWSFFEDRNGYLWIGTEEGLNKLDFKTEEFVQYTHDPNNPNSLSDKTVYSIYKDKDNILWLGTAQGGLTRFDEENNEYTRFMHNPDDPRSIAFNYVKSIIEDKNGTIWLGLRGKGLDKFNRETQTFTHYQHDSNNPNSLSHNRVNVLFEDKNGFIWIGTSGGGVNKFDPKTEKFKTYKLEEDNPYCLNDIYVMSINQDKNGNMWIGTWDGGLNKFDVKSGKFYHYNQEQGLANNVIYGILIDDNENIWVSTNKGISMFDPQTKTFTNYDKSHGLQGDEFNTMAFHHGRSGRMYFGGINGFNVFRPENIKPSNYKPPILITEFKVFNKPVVQRKNSILKYDISQTHDLTLSYKDYIFSFEFSALSFSSQHKNQYAYMMEGLDKDWIYSDAKNRQATYTNLNGGKYIFKVKGSNADGVWNNEATKIVVTITPPFWETWWFRTISIIILIGAVYYWYRARIKRIERQKKILEQQVKERTAEVVMQKEEIEAQRDKIEEAFNNVKLLSEIGQEITGTLEVEKIIETGYANVNELMDATIFSVGVYNPAEEAIQFPGTIEKGEKLPMYQHPVSDENRIGVFCFKHMEDIMINDFTTEYSKYIDAIQPPKVGESPLSIIYLPLQVKEKKVGVITVQSFKKKAYTLYHLDILKNLANYTAIAIENAFAYEQIEQRNNEIEKQAEELKLTNDALKREREYTMGSIRYAQTIQRAILPIRKNIDAYFNTFVIFRPKDIVSGDFYWNTIVKQGNKTMFFFAVVDCTGHGVPGAFMSMIGNRILNELVNQKGVYAPDEILAGMEKDVIKALKQDQTDNDDGMDICLCRIDRTDDKECKVLYSGAKRPLYYYSGEKNEIVKVKGVRKGVGGIQRVLEEINYQTVEVSTQNGDILYLSSDGLIDQNAPNRKKFGSKHLLEVLNEVGSLSLDEQYKRLTNELDNHQQDEPQRDDITFWGIKLAKR